MQKTKVFLWVCRVKKPTATCGERTEQGVIMGHRGNLATFEHKGTQGQYRRNTTQWKTSPNHPFFSLSIIAYCVCFRSAAWNRQNTRQTGILSSPLINHATTVNFTSCRANFRAKKELCYNIIELWCDFNIFRGNFKLS